MFFYQIYTNDGGDMTMQTNLNMSSHKIMNSTNYLNGILNTNDGVVLIINGCDNLSYQIIVQLLA